jgi:hypothetical protein
MNKYGVEVSGKRVAMEIKRQSGNIDSFSGNMITKDVGKIIEMIRKNSPSAPQVA